MTKKDLLNNIRSNYGKLGIYMKAIEKIIKSGEKQGFTYSKIYAGIRLAMYLEYGTLYAAAPTIEELESNRG